TSGASVTEPLGAFDMSIARRSDVRLTYRQLAIGQMSQDELLSILAARKRYKNELFAEAFAALEKDPTLADMNVCKTMEQMESGDCLADEALIAAAKAAAAGTAMAAAPASSTSAAGTSAAPGTYPLPAPASA